MKSDRLILVYDTNTMPISFDICWAVTWADLQRKKLGKKYLDVLIVNLDKNYVHPRPPGDPAHYSTEELRSRITQIIVPVIQMYRNVSNIIVCDPDTPFAEALELRAFPGHVVYAPEISIIHHQILASKEKLAGFTAGADGKYALECLLRPETIDNVVSITIRQSTEDEARNSCLDQWNLFADEIHKQGYKPVFIPDTGHWFEKREWRGLVFPEIALNIRLRVALYEASVVNLFVNNGPAALCHLSPGIPYLCFKMLRQDTRLATKEHLIKLGFTIGATPPFATDNQKWVWEDDSFPVIYREFLGFRTRHGIGRSA
jgi:hypothetical protein